MKSFARTPAEMGDEGLEPAPGLSSERDELSTSAAKSAATLSGPEIETLVEETKQVVAMGWTTAGAVLVDELMRMSNARAKVVQSAKQMGEPDGSLAGLQSALDALAKLLDGQRG